MPRKAGVELGVQGTGTEPSKKSYAGVAVCFIQHYMSWGYMADYFSASPPLFFFFSFSFSLCTGAIDA